MLDTNICIYIIKKRPPSVRERFAAFRIGELCISAITVSELLYGVEKSGVPEKNRRALEAFLLPLDVAEYDFKAAVEYGKIRASLEKEGRVIGGLDMQIAAHARALDLTLITNNLKEFERVAGLRVDNWV